jgi:hypothetical protein
MWDINHRTCLIQHPDAPASMKYELSLANLAELFFWLGWLRASEAFTLRWGDVERILADEAGGHGLPPNTGAFLLKLLESTKSHQTEQVDVVIAARTASGLNVGDGYAAAVAQCPAGTVDTDLIFRSLNGQAWDSHYFRHTHVHPLLAQQRLEGDP